MATAGDSLKWQELLEIEFDRSYSELSALLDEIDPDQAELSDEGHKRLTSINSSFAQLSQKAVTTFQNNAKLEAQLVGLQSELLETLSTKSALKQESQRLLLELHSAQLQQQQQQSSSIASDEAAKVSSEEIRKQLECDTQQRQQQMTLARDAANRLWSIRQDNARLKRYSMAILSELYGAKLAAKYLDKELAGRVQQIQLLGRRMEGPEHDRLWSQLEAEIQLHRQKSVLRAVRDKELPLAQKQQKQQQQQQLSCIRTVTLHKLRPNDELGLSITGGSEYSQPIIVSEIRPNTPAANANPPLLIGDALLSVNGVSLRHHRHAMAAKLLVHQPGTQVQLHVVLLRSEQDFRQSDKDQSSLTVHPPQAANSQSVVAMASPANGSAASSADAAALTGVSTENNNGNNNNSSLVAGARNKFASVATDADDDEDEDAKAHRSTDDADDEETGDSDSQTVEQLK